VNAVDDVSAGLVVWKFGRSSLRGIAGAGKNLTVPPVRLLAVFGR